MDFKKPPKEKLKKILSKVSYKVTQENKTEKPFSDNNYNDEKRKGIYVDIVSGEPLFSSKNKYNSGTGWPSFNQPIDKNFITTHDDTSIFRRKRIEVRSRYADSHLGHVFSDGPEPTGLRYCVNGAALQFIPIEEMEEKGYKEYIPFVE